MTADLPPVALEPVVEPLRLLEALLFASAEPMTLTEIQAFLGPEENATARLAELQALYAGRGVDLVKTGEAYSFRTAPDLAPHMKRTVHPRRKLPRVAAEVLAIIAYHQPVTRADIEAVRGVETGRGALDLLLELGWIRPGRRRETPGRPLTWGTTPMFLSAFNLASLNDLPGLEDLQAAGFLETRPLALSPEPPDSAPEEEGLLLEDV